MFMESIHTKISVLENKKVHLVVILLLLQCLYMYDFNRDQNVAVRCTAGNM